MLDVLASGEPLYCVLCGRPLGILSDDQPEWPSGPICGDCYQARQQEDEMHHDMYGDEG